MHSAEAPGIASPGLSTMCVAAHRRPNRADAGPPGSEQIMREALFEATTPPLTGQSANRSIEDTVVRSIMGQLHHHQSRALLNADAAVRKGEERCAGRWRCAGPKRHASGPAARHGAVGRADGRRRDSDLIRPGSLGECPLAPQASEPQQAPWRITPLPVSCAGGQNSACRWCGGGRTT